MSEPMTDERLEEIENRAEWADEGPWAFTEPSAIVSARDSQVTDETVCIVSGLYSRRHRNGDFIAHARQDVPVLIDEVRRLRKMLRRSGTARIPSSRHPFRSRE
jgi:hypothetical protein